MIVDKCRIRVYDMYNCTIKMKVVVDTSVIIAVLTNEKHKKELIRKTAGADLVAPSSLHWEVGNAFSAMLKRNRIILDLIYKALDTYSEITIRFKEVGLKETMRLCAKYDLYAYDAYFIACAQKYNLPLLSLDKVLIRAAIKSGVEVREVMS